MTKTGKVEFILSGVGSKSEKMQPFLREADGNLVEIFKESDNPFKNESLKEYEGKTVMVTGEENEYGLLIIDKIEVTDGAEAAKEAPSESETTEKAAVEVIEEETTVTEEAEEKSEEATETASETEEATAKTETDAPKKTPVEPELKGIRKFLAFFHRK